MAKRRGNESCQEDQGEKREIKIGLEFSKTKRYTSHQEAIWLVWT